MTQSTSDIVSDKIFKKPDTVGRRTRLREFQAQLVERMQAARSGVDTRVNQLGVMIGQTRWLLSLQEAGEIVSVGTITPVPLTRDWFLGLANIRGNLISVIDFARFQGQVSSPIDKDCRIVAFAPGLSFNSGLLVSRVMGLRNIAEMELQTNNPADVAPWSTRQYVDKESQVWQELNLSLVVQDPQFLHVGL
ncbi:MAG: putative chemotaxis signal transduction protein CheW-like, putative PilI [Herminiimonas sp.]|nr:putative chemotaxis signal transduction protein CheW-like, putative PilI [Herminiimonas sp.]